MIDFRRGRALLMPSDIFTPFRVAHTVRLADALSCEIVSADDPVLVAERGAWVLALLTRQMLYHHVAQGEMAGEPWMVSY